MRPGAALLAAAAASLLAHFLLPLPPGDPFRGTLVLLPAVVGALVVLAAWARRAGGAPAPRRVARLEAVALGGLVLLVLARGHLAIGPPATVDRVLAAALALLLAHRVLRLLLALRPALGRRLPARPPWPFFALPLVVYLALLPWSASQRPPDGDEPYYLLIAHSLAFDLDAELSNNYAAGDSLRFMARRLEPQPGDPTGPGGERYSRHNLLLPLLLALPYRLAGPAGALATMTLFAAALAWMVLRLAERFRPGRPGEALLAYGVTAFAAPLLLYAHQVWVEVPAALLIAVVLDQLYRESVPASDGRRRTFWRRTLIAGSLLLLPLLKIRFAAIAGPLILLAFWRSSRLARRRALALAGGLAAVVAGILLFNQLLYGNPLKYHNPASLRLYAASPATYARGLVGLFFDCAFGLLSYAPIWLLALPAALLLAARRARRGFEILFVYLPYLLLLGPRGEWFGAWSPPFRYGMVLLPVLALLLIPPLAGRRRTGLRALATALGALTLVLTLLWVAAPGWTYNLAHGRSHLLDFLSTGVGADVGRFFASSIRLRAATWLWPVAATAAAALLWWRPRRAARRHAAAWGLSALLLAPALLVAAAHRLPSRVLEFEDPQVRKSAGSLFPRLWTVGRPRYRGGWVLPAGQQVTAPLVAGGEHLHLTLELRSVGRRAAAAALEFRAGATLLGRAPLERDGRWRELAIELAPWPAGEPLVVALVASPAARTRRTQVILNRARLRWTGG